MTGTIGIKLANGDFFSILKENSAETKRLVLTTVHDNQKSVQIDLYKSMVQTMADAQYIGSIVVENLAAKPKGDPSIEMTLCSNTDGTVAATALDLANTSNEYQLNVSLESLEEDSSEYPDFDMDDEIKDMEEAPKAQSLRFAKKGDFSTHKEKNCPLQKFCCRKFPWLIAIIIGLVILLLCLGLVFFLYVKRNSLPSSIARPSSFAGLEQTAALHLVDRTIEGHKY